MVPTGGIAKSERPSAAPQEVPASVSVIIRRKGARAPRRGHIRREVL